MTCRRLMQVGCQPGACLRFRRGGNKWVRGRNWRVDGPQPPSRSTITSHKSGRQCEDWRNHAKQWRTGATTQAFCYECDCRNHRNVQQLRWQHCQGSHTKHRFMVPRDTYHGLPSYGTALNFFAVSLANFFSILSCEKWTIQRYCELHLQHIPFKQITLSPLPREKDSCTSNDVLRFFEFLPILWPIICKTQQFLIFYNSEI